MQIETMDSRYGALPEESHQAGRVPGPMPRKGPPQATGGHPGPFWKTRKWEQRENTTGQTTRQTRGLNILHWNAEGIYHKKQALTVRLDNDKIDVACIQETHLNPHHRFSIRGYQTFRQDREGHKGGVITLIRNTIPAKQIEINTIGESEIIGTDVHIDNQPIRIYNIYSSIGRALKLQAMDITDTHCIVVGDFNNHSERWGY